MSIYTDKKKLGKTSKRNLGHLKLSVHEDSSALIVTIHEVRGLKRKEGAPNDTYVKIYILPDPLKQTKEKTKRSKERDPVFNEKFTFILKDHHDLTRRLHISVWNRDRTARSEMIGCMSFLIGDLIGPNKIQGWYQLLDESRGKVENIQVPNTIITMGSQSSLSSTASAPPTIMKPYAVTLIRGPKGYGFKVTPGTPVYINEIIEGMPAHQSDIQVGDLIIEVDGTNVMHADGDMVANMIKKQRETLQLILQRKSIPTSPTAIGLPSSLSASYLSHSQFELPSLPNSHYKHPVFSSQILPTTRMFPTDARRSSTGGLTQPLESSYFEPSPADLQRLKMMSSSRDKVTLSRDRLLPELPEESSQSSFTDQQVPSNGRRLSQQDDHPSSLMTSARYSLSQPNFEVRSISPVKSARKYSTNSSLGSPSEDDLESSGLYNLAMQSIATSKLFPGASGPPLISYQLRTKASSTSVTSTDSAYITDQLENDVSPHSSYDHFREKSPPHMDTAQQYIFPTPPKGRGVGGGASSNGINSDDEFIEWESLSRLEQKRQRAINSLIKCEIEFFEELKKGIKLYMTPLSSGILSENSLRTIFMNLDRMYELSRYFKTQILSRALHYSNSSNPVSLYVENFADVYHSKLDLFKQIFSGYLRNSENSRKEIAVAFTNTQFKRIVQESMISDNAPSIYSFVEAGSEYLPKMSRLLVSISYVTPLHHEDHQYLTAIICTLMTILPPSCHDLKQNWMSEISIMEKLKASITFGSEVEAFDLMLPGRVLLHEEEIQIIEKKKKRKAVLFLFSDILLITKKTGRSFAILEPSIPLQDMIVQDINCGQEEFQVSLSNGTFSRLMKAPSLQAKNQWMQKLKERATGSLKVQRILPKEEDPRQKELKHELMKEKRTPFKAHPPSKLIEDSPIRTLNSNLSVVTGHPIMSSSSQPVGMIGLPSKFNTTKKSHDSKSHDKIADEEKFSRDSLIHKKSKSPDDKPHKTSSAGSSSPSWNILRRPFKNRRRRSIDMSNASATQVEDEDSSLCNRSAVRQSWAGFPTAMSQPVISNDIFPLFKFNNKDTAPASGNKKKSKDESQLSLAKMSAAKLRHWATSFDNLLSDPIGIQLFEEFLRKECSQENILFWKDCQRFQYCSQDKLQSEAERIYAEYISHDAPNLVNIDHTVRDEVVSNMSKITNHTFDRASDSIYMLMQRDSYSRFVKLQEFKVVTS